MRQSVTYEGSKSSLAPAILFTITALIFGADLLADFLNGSDLLHLSTEGAGMVIGLAGAVVFLRRWTREWAEATRAVRRLSGEAQRWQHEAERWRAETRHILAGLSEAIDRLLSDWGLTPAEAEVALLLLKGLSLKEVAAVRGTSERTARDQARAVYRKGGLSGRAELQGFFLEDLLLPLDRDQPTTM